MTATLTTSLTVALKADLRNPGTLTTPQDLVDLVKAIALPDGTGSGTARKSYHDQRTLAASSGEDLDFSGSLTDALGQAFALTKIQALVCIAGAANPGNILVAVGKAAAINSFLTSAQVAGAADMGIAIQPGGILVLASGGAGYDVTAATADLFRWSSSASTGNHTLDIYVIGK